MTISVHEAQIRTASVEIKSLTVSGKQVTLAVFRQLLREPLYDDETMTVNGIPWGTVNYHPDRCADDRNHHHVVWQKGLELRRAQIDDPTLTPQWTSPLAKAWLEAAVVEGAWRPDPDARRVLGRSSYGGLDFRIPGWEGLVRIFPSEDVRLSFDPHPATSKPAFERLAGKVQRSADDLQGLLLHDLEEQRRRWQWRKECWQSLGLLPQLFIAV